MSGDAGTVADCGWAKVRSGRSIELSVLSRERSRCSDICRQVIDAPCHGLSDGSRSRFAMSAEDGKIEVVAVTHAYPDLCGKEQAAGAANAAGAFGEGLVVMKMHRSPAEGSVQGELIIARRNPNALWLSDYEDRIIYDGHKRARQDMAV